MEGRLFKYLVTFHTFLLPDFFAFCLGPAYPHENIKLDEGRDHVLFTTESLVPETEPGT